MKGEIFHIVPELFEYTQRLVYSEIRPKRSNLRRKGRGNGKRGGE